MNASILRFLAADLDHEVVGADVDDPAAEHLDQQADLDPLLRRGLDLDEHQVALDEVLAADVLHLDDGDDLVELLADLLQLGVVAVDDEGHARQVGLLGLADGEAVDVEAARGEHAGDVGQDAGLVLHQRRQDVPH